jgi:hypothetical protein
MQHFPKSFHITLIIVLSAVLSAAHASKSTASQADFSNVPSTLNVLYIEPGNLNSDVHVLNEKSTLGNHYKKGWILPSGQELTLTLYLYYDSPDESKIRPFIKNATHIVSGTSNTNNNSNSVAHLPKGSGQQYFQTLYMFFTPKKNCLDYLSRSSWPVEIVERTAPNMYKAQLKSLIMIYSDEPLHICMQQFDVDDNIMDQNRFELCCLLYIHISFYSEVSNLD